jgi:hypothetical protein
MRTLVIAAALIASAAFGAYLQAQRATGSSFVFASVAADGSLVAGSGVALVVRLGPGNYAVQFTTPVADCAALATVEMTQSWISSQHSGYVVGVQTGSILIEKGLASADRAFNVAVFC